MFEAANLQTTLAIFNHLDRYECSQALEFDAARFGEDNSCVLRLRQLFR